MLAPKPARGPQMTPRTLESLAHALVGAVNLTNRAQRGLFVEEDVERVRLLGLVMFFVAHQATLAEQLLGTIGGH